MTDVKKVGLLQLGIGLIGSGVISQVVANRERWRSELGIDLVYRGFLDRSTGFSCPDDEGYVDYSLGRVAAAKGEGRRLIDVADELNYTKRSAGGVLANVLHEGRTIVIDTSIGAGSAELEAQALRKGAGLVFSNKAPLALDLGDPNAKALWSARGRTGPLRYETTCGAGLPVISTLGDLLDSGDRVIEITGMLSGTMGAIFSSVGAGARFSEAVIAAREAGYTEPDPRDDLSGLDVARKALILARTIGRQIDLNEIAIESLVPEELAAVSVGEFLDRLPDHDDEFAKRVEQAAAAGETLKYLALVKPEGAISVGVRQFPGNSTVGSLQGPENCVSVRTIRYDRYPLTVLGPGAGADVTAAGVVADLLDLATRMA